jgi:hypothetical protein
MTSNNAAIVALNTLPGFVPQKAYLTFHRDLNRTILQNPGRLEGVRRLLTTSWLLICVAIIVFWTVLPPSPAWVDRTYTGGFYTALASVLVPLTGSVALPVTALLLGALLVWLVLSTTLSQRRPRGWRAPLRWLGRGVAAAVTLYALFIVMWGANYGRDAARDPAEPLRRRHPEHPRAHRLR